MGAEAERGAHQSHVPAADRGGACRSGGRQAREVIRDRRRPLMRFLSSSSGRSRSGALAAVVLAVIGAALAWGALRRGGDGPEVEPTLPGPEARPPERRSGLLAFEESLRGLYRRVAPSTVNLFAEPRHEHVGSGVVIDARGHVLTHAHGGLVPGAVVTAAFPDGKKVAGKVVGVHESFDLSHVQLEGGPWPAVPLGDVAALRAGDRCVLLGYPKMPHKEGQPPLLRLGRYTGAWGHYLETSCNLNGGDSGGPLFGLDGKLLGNNNLHAMPTAERGTGHTSIAYFGQAREQLLLGRHVKWEK